MLQREEAAMSSDSDPRWDDPRDRDDESRDVEVHWIDLGRSPGSDRQSEDGTRDGDHDGRDRARDHDSRERRHDPRDVFLDGLELPRGLEREIVLDRGYRYEINGEESRTLAATGAFRVVSERDLSDPRDVRGTSSSGGGRVVAPGALQGSRGVEIRGPTMGRGP